jgi:metallo-beta-lactamase class B
MRALLTWLGAAVVVAVHVCTANAQSADEHIAAARAAAGSEHAGMVDRLCPAPVGASSSRVRPAAGARPAGDPPRDSWHAEPAKVFDNLYFVGMTEFSSWAIPTSDGIIVIDPVFDYSVEDEVVEGLRKLGHDPADIKYVLISHGHLDHAGGAKLLQERFGARLLMTAADWDMVERDNPRWKPRRDLEITDGQKLTLGDTTLTLYITPGHTNGTVSTLIPLRDGDARHLGALWGGTLFNFGPDPARFEAYAASAARMRDLVTVAGADVLLSNHTDYDGTKTKLPVLAVRTSREPHPYVVGTDSVRRYLTVANECAQAALASAGPRAGSAQQAENARVASASPAAASPVAAVLWQPSMNVFRRFSVEPTAMFEFYGAVLGLEQLSTLNVGGGGGGVARFQAGGSELKLTARVAERTYEPGGVRDATGVRLVTLLFADEAALVERFREHGYAIPKFQALPGTDRKAALVMDPDGQQVELIIVPGASAEVLAQIEIGVTVTDIDVSRAFYRGFVGLDEFAPVADPIFGTIKYPFRHGTTTINLRSFGTQLPADTGSGGIQYVVSDVNAVDAAAKEQHITIDQPLSALQGFSLRTIWLDDPDGITNYFAETAASRRAGTPQARAGR